MAKISRFRVTSIADGINVEVDYVLNYGYPIPQLMSMLRRAITYEIESLTSLNVKKLILTAKSVVV